MNPPIRYTFEGEQVTAPELHKRMPAYSVQWLRRALQDGCTTRMDLAQREYECRQRARMPPVRESSKMWRKTVWQ